MAADFRTELDRQVDHFKSISFSLNTKKAYAVHKRAYIAFCNLLRVPPVPADTQLLCRYAVYLSRHLKFNSIKQYMNIVRLLHQEWGVQNPCLNNFHLTATLRGIKRHLGATVCRKLPITPELLKIILNALAINTPKGASVWAACVLMFFGLLRRSNVMLQDKDKFDPNLHLRRKDLHFTPEGLRVVVRWTKTIQGEERTLTIRYPRKKGHPLCPTTGVYHALRLSRSAPVDGPALVCDASPSPGPLTAAIFVQMVREALRAPGRDTSQYAGHSFRRGGACWAFENNINIDLIRMLGDWKSNAYTSYVLPSELGLSGATDAMLKGIPL